MAGVGARRDLRPVACEGWANRSEEEVAELIVSILVLLVVARALGEVFERFHQSAMIGEIMAGMLLGPAILRFIHTPDQLDEMRIVADIGVFLLVLLAGLEMSMDEVSKSLRGGGVLVGGAGFLVPFVAGYFLAVAVGMGTTVALFLGLALAVTALPVSVRILLDLGLTDHRVGRLVVSAAILNDLLALTILGIILNLQGTGDQPLESVLYIGVFTLLKTALLVSIVVTFVQALKISRGVTSGAQRRVRLLLSMFRGRESLFAFAILFVLVFASISEILGLHFVVGAFFGGLVLSSQLLGEYNFKQVERTTSALSYGFLAPIFFGYIGLLFVPDAIVENPGLTMAVLAVAVAGKLAGGYIGGRLAGLGTWFAVALGMGLNGRGLIEIVVATLAFNLGLIDSDLFSVLVFMTVVTTVMTPPTLKWAFARASAGAKATKPDERKAPRGPSAALHATVPADRASALTNSASIVIIGGGRVATEIARSVGECSILERDPNQAKVIATLLSEARVIVGSATDEADLRRAGIGPGAVVLAVTDQDAANEFVVRFARREKARRVIARTEQTAEAERLRELGADAVLNSAEETASAILLEMYPPDATMVEMLIPKGSTAIGKPLRDVALPRGTVVRSIERRGRVLVPTPDSALEPRDSVILSGTPAGLRNAREALLGPLGAGDALSILSCHSTDERVAVELAHEVSPIALLSRGALLATVPWEPPGSSYGDRVAKVYRECGAGAEIVRGYATTAGDLQDALAAARIPPPAADAAPEGASEVNVPVEQRWVVAVHHTSVGKGDGSLTLRQVPSLPSLLGVPLYVARLGRPPRSVTALLDGAEAADRAGTLACDIARLVNARLTLLVVRFEDEPEPLEQATYVESYARNIGLGFVERVQVDHAASPMVERQLRKSGELVVAASIPRAIRSRFLGQLAAQGESSILLT